MGDEGSADKKRPGRLLRAVDRVGEWLLPDPAAQVDRMWDKYREQRGWGPEKKTQ